MHKEEASPYLTSTLPVKTQLMAVISPYNWTDLVAGTTAKGSPVPPVSFSFTSFPSQFRYLGIFMNNREKIRKYFIPSADPEQQ